MEYDVQTLRLGGIYAIVNKENGRRYIGQTGRFIARWTKHKLLLRRGEHPTKALQADWNLYGSDAFEFIILYTTKSLDLIEIEREYINQVDNPYNTVYKRLPAKEAQP
jgi:group I intron endonuclease